jgi:hypothetical protein
MQIVAVIDVILEFLFFLTIADDLQYLTIEMTVEIVVERLTDLTEVDSV